MNQLRQQTQHFPHKPGCYLFKDTTGLVLYVGKAKDLRKRVSQYFGADRRPQLPFLIEDASSIDYIVARSELEALFLENTLIKKHNPKYNIKLKDDKNYAFITINYSTQIPQIGYARKIEEDIYSQTFINPSANWGSGKRESKVFKSKVKSRLLSVKNSIRNPFVDSHEIRRFASQARRANYFGPYSSIKKIRETLDFVRKIFPYCANTEVGSRPCFYYHLHRCPGVCVGTMSLDEYQKSLSRIKLFLNGKTLEIKKELKASMAKAAKTKRFELAARLRDQLRALEILDERQIAQFPTKVNYDFISLASQNNLYCVNLFKVRDGKLTDKEDFIYSNPSTEISNLPKSTPSQSAILQSFTETYYAETTDIPSAVFTQYPLTDISLVEQLLKHRVGKKIGINVPHRGKSHQLIKLGQVNAEECMRKNLANDATDADKINNSLQKLQKLLKLEKLPRRIECYDMSNTQGTNPVGSMVVFIDGKPAKSEYRKFKIRSKNTPDDFAMMRETLARRLARVDSGQVTGNSKHSDSNLSPVTSNLPKWPRPDLIVIDGGKGQLSAALEAQQKQERLQVTGNSKDSNSNLYPLTSNLPTIPMIGLAKRIEEIFLPHNPEPIILSYDDPTLQLLQRLRDEAHRFGITFHRNLRSKQATKSALDTIPGIGPKTKKLLKAKFGTIANIKSTEIDALVELVGKSKANIIRKYL